MHYGVGVNAIAQVPGKPPIVLLLTDAGFSSYQTTIATSRKLASEKMDVTDGIGTMSDTRWTNFYESMTEVEVFPKGLDIRQAYTLELVNKGIGKS